MTTRRGPRQDAAEVSTQRAAPGSELLARARTSFLVDEPLVSGLVRQPILDSWTRSRLCRVPTDRLEVPFDPDVDTDTPLMRAAAVVLRDLADRLSAEPVSAILCDARGTVLQRHTGDARLEQKLDRVQLAPGYSYAEQHVGTNGIGTALESQGTARVFGHEHYVEHLEDLACAGVPVRYRLTGKIVGVVDLTCWRRDAGMMMVAAASTIAGRIEELLVEQSGRRELALLHDYLMVCRRNRGAVLGVGTDLLMLNDQARELLDPGDQAPLVAEALDALASGQQQLVVDLPSGLTARVLCRPSFRAGGVTDGVLQVLPIAEAGGSASRALPPSPAPTLPTLVGSGTLWTRCWQALDRHFQAREWVVLEGEPGTGKGTLARAAHQGRTPAAHLRVLDAEDFGPQWLSDVTAELQAGGGSLVLTHVDRLGADGVEALADVLAPHVDSTAVERPWVVLTLRQPGRDRADLAPVLECFPRTIAVPPLRHHVEDVAELVPHLLARFCRGREISCSPEVMRVLMRNRWPGNVEQLAQVLLKVTAKRRSGVLELRDLPPECRATRRRVLSPLEAIECDAIVDALSETDGNKAEAARLLGMSRATIYRKLRGYGITTPGPGGPPGRGEGEG